jgi:hypothetical protein
MSCEDSFIVMPLLVLLLALNAAEVILLLGMTMRLNAARDTIMDAIEARLLEIEKRP